MYRTIKIVVCFFLFIFFGGCDNYNDTRIEFSSDKTEYKIGDDIVLTLNIIPTKGAKQIKIYSDLSNTNIDGVLKFKRNPNEGLDYRFEKVKKITGAKKKPQILKYNITSENPLKYDIKGKILENDTAYIIDFSSIETTYFINKNKYSEAEIFGFEGNCAPIHAPFGYSYEDYIEFFSITIK